MGHPGHNLSAPNGRQVGKNQVNDSSANVCEGIAVEEKKRGAAVAAP